MIKFKNVSNSESAELIKNKEDLLILDVRTDMEVSYGKIPNSLNIELSELEYGYTLIEPYKEKPILVYCKAGVRSAVACDYLSQLGFKDLYNLETGIMGYDGELE